MLRVTKLKRTMTQWNISKTFEKFLSPFTDLNQFWQCFSAGDIKVSSVTVLRQHKDQGLHIPSILQTCTSPRLHKSSRKYPATVQSSNSHFCWKGSDSFDVRGEKNTCCCWDRHANLPCQSAFQRLKCICMQQQQNRKPNLVECAEIRLRFYSPES